MLKPDENKELNLKEFIKDFAEDAILNKDEFDNNQMVYVAWYKAPQIKYDNYFLWKKLMNLFFLFKRVEISKSKDGNIITFVLDAQLNSFVKLQEEFSRCDYEI